MSLENVFLYDSEPRKPSENLAINRAIVNAIKDNRYSSGVRVYKHEKGLILGNKETKIQLTGRFSLGLDFCEKSSRNRQDCNIACW